MAAKFRATKSRPAVFTQQTDGCSEFNRRRSVEMGRRMIFRFAAAALLCAAWVVGAQAQDFRQSFNLAPGGSITIKNVSGDINISGYDGATVEVTAYKEGRDRDQVSVENLSTAGHVSLRADYADHCDCDASLRFEVKVPRSVRFD